ncbi:CpaB family protein [Nocardioides okcheonensis]|uniref:hypothetical protein n=1 Tax=Nocardioides okcheonensis TaxID=2894081 RepID=UPI001E38DE59|nr:hypothetical protein [Nocardioides okcheonensis]UFN46514.1 hypothetical protein LN652_10030 [Nocardioides okcheonensis]
MPPLLRCTRSRRRPTRAWRCWSPPGTCRRHDARAGRPRRAFPEALVPAGAARAGAGRVLAAPLASGEVLTEARVVGPGLARAQPGETVLPVRLPDPGMAALLRPGDEVDLVATDPGTGETRVVARDVRVLSGTADVPEAPTGQGGALVVVGVSAAEAVDVTSAALAQFLTVSWSR